MITFDCGIVNVIYGRVTTENNQRFYFILRKRTLMYEQDGAPVHFSRAARSLLHENLKDRWSVDRGSPQNWPSCSPDWAMNDFWLWRYTRDKIYKSPRPKFIGDFRDGIAIVFDSIDKPTIRRVYSNICKRCEACVSAQGAPFEQLL